MKNILSTDPPATQIIIQVEEAEEISSRGLVEEFVLYDECGDTQWDKVLAQHDLTGQSGKSVQD